MTFCMNVSRFMNLAAIFSLDLESQCMFLRSFICEEDFSVTTVIGSSQSVVA